MNDRRRTFLLGAGFSKAVADGPVMGEIWDLMEKAYEKEKGRKDFPAENNNRCKCFEDLKEFITKLEKCAISEINIKEYDSVQVGFKENIEYLFTLIDLCLTGPKIKLIKEGSDVDPYPAIPLSSISKSELEQIKSCFLTYLYIIFEKLRPNCWADKFAELVEKNDNIITYNYDLVLEKALWKRNLWFPFDGYVGVEMEKNDKQRFEKASKYSPMKIHKMHGSICWEYRDYFGIHNNKDIFVNLDNIENWGFHFDGLKEILGREPIRPSGQMEAQISQGYAGKHDPPWVLPSFIKPFENTQFYEIWRSAANVLSKTEELVVIGYSFRPEDSNSWLLMSELPERSEIKLVDPHLEEIRNKLSNKGHFNVTKVFNSLEEYLGVEP